MMQSGTASGRWWLEGDRFKGYVEASDLMAFRRGYQWIDEVVLVSETDLILRNESGYIEAYRRQSPAD